MIEIDSILGERIWNLSVILEYRYVAAVDTFSKYCYCYIALTNQSSVSQLEQFNHAFVELQIYSITRTLKESQHKPRYISCKTYTFASLLFDYRYPQSNKENGHIHTPAHICPNHIRIDISSKTMPERFYPDLLTLHGQRYLQHILILPDFDHPN